MQVAQRGTSSTTNGFSCVDRFKTYYGGADEAPTFAQHALTSSDTGPWEKGFRYSLHATNGNQSSGAGAADELYYFYSFEAQDLANSGWNYTSASSYITLSFWIKSSVAQNFYGSLVSRDGSNRQHPFETGSLSANTWTKITKTIPGEANISIDNDNGEGMSFAIYAFNGTNYTASGVTLDEWATKNNAGAIPDMTSTWWTTNDATFEITGVQLEVGDVATDFEHRSYADELRRCQRYYWKVSDGKYRRVGGYKRHDNSTHWNIQAPVPMRTAPSPTLDDGGMFTNFQSTYTASQSSPVIAEWNTDTGQGLLVVESTYSSTHVFIPSWESYVLQLSAEL